MIFSVQLLKSIGRLLGRKVSLSVGKHLVAHHELLYCRWSQEWRVVQGMKLPMTLVGIQIGTYKKCKISSNYFTKLQAE